MELEYITDNWPGYRSGRFAESVPSHALAEWRALRPCTKGPVSNSQQSWSEYSGQRVRLTAAANSPLQPKKSRCKSRQITRAAKAIVDAAPASSRIHVIPDNPTT